MRVGSLFSGIGGLDLGLERAGMTVVWQSEIDPYASKVLAKHWPDVPNLGDITSIDWSGVEPVDLICGGYPCQPFSLAGARAGTDDARHLWPYFANAIRELRPRWVLLENVPGHLSLGFGQVLADLASIGYDAEWDCIPASSVGAHHQRDRVFIVAHTSWPRSGTDTGGAPGDEGADEGWSAIDHHVARGDGESGRAAHVADTSRQCVGTRLCEGETVTRYWPVFGDRDGLGDAWPAEPDVGRVAYGVPSRVDRLKCLGNAVVPQVAEWVGRRIMALVDNNLRATECTIRITDVPLGGVGEQVVDVLADLGIGPVGRDGDGERVVHLQHNDKPAHDVKRQSALSPEQWFAEGLGNGGPRGRVMVKRQSA